MGKPEWRHSIVPGREGAVFHLSEGVELSVLQVQDSLRAMQGISAPNPLYEVLVKAATEYMALGRGQTATEQRMREEQAQKAYREAEDLLRKASESMQDSIFKSAFGGGRSGGFFFKGDSAKDFNARFQQRPAPPPPPRHSGPKPWPQVLGLDDKNSSFVTKAECKAAYKRRAMEIHQKHGGDEGAMHDEMVELNVAKREFEKVFGK